MKEGQISPVGIAHGWKLLIMGGLGRGNSPLPTGQVFDTASREWYEFPSMPSPARCSFGTAVVGTEFLVISGGLDGKKSIDAVDVYHHTSRQWHHIENANLKSARSGHFSISMGSRLIMIGRQAGSKKLATIEVITDIESVLQSAISSCGEQAQKHPGARPQAPAGNVSAAAFIQNETLRSRPLNARARASPLPYMRVDRVIRGDATDPSLVKHVQTIEVSLAGDSTTTQHIRSSKNGTVASVMNNTQPSPEVDCENEYSLPPGRPVECISSPTMTTPATQGQQCTFYASIMNAQDSGESVMTMFYKLIPCMTNMYEFKIFYTMSAYYQKLG